MSSCHFHQIKLFLQNRFDILVVIYSFFSLILKANLYSLQSFASSELRKISLFHIKKNKKSKIVLANVIETTRRNHNVNIDWYRNDFNQMSEQTIKVESWSKMSRSNFEAIIEVEFSNRISKSLLRMLKYFTDRLFSWQRYTFRSLILYHEWSTQIKHRELRWFRIRRNVCTNIEIACKYEKMRFDWIASKLSRFRNYSA